jgi:hypothetical protein
VLRAVKASKLLPPMPINIIRSIIWIWYEPM